MRNLGQGDHLGNTWPSILPAQVTQPAEGARVSALNVLSLAASPMMVTDETDTATGIDWEVRTAPGGGGISAFTSVNASILGINVPALTLGVGMEYYVRARWRGAAMGPGPWSADVHIST